MPFRTTASGADPWVRARLGSAGAPRSDLLGRLRDRVPSDGGEVALGLDDAALERLLPDDQAELLADGTSGARGDPDRLRRIVWWGAALADVPGTATGTARAEGGRFNLAVALFDSVVDDTPDRVPALARALAPGRLRRRIARPDDERTALTTEPTGLGPLVRLFDEALVDAGRRLRTQPRRLDRLGDLLEAMFLSELRATDDPFAAKRLPVIFIGALVDGGLPTARLFLALAEFLWLWDDWLDLADDLRRLRPNAFLGRCGSRAGRAGACARGGLRLLAGPTARSQVAGQVEGAFVRTLAAASQAGGEPYRRTLSFHRELLA